MGRAVVVSLEDTTIKVVYASLKGRDVIVKDALKLKDDQLDDFLLKEKTKEFIVVNSFKDSFQDTVLIPSVKKSFIRKLLEAEIEKRAALNDFSFLYTVLGEKVVENRRLKEFFVFAVRNEELRDIINRFVNKGKVVKAIYPDIFSIACLIETDIMPVLCVSEAGLNKNIFLIKDGKLQFLRTAQSLEQGINDIDIENINMTVNYCRQALRINPSFILLAGGLCSNYNAVAVATLPVACLIQEPGARTGPHSARRRLQSPAKSGFYGLGFLDFVSPISSFFIPSGIDMNLLPGEYRNFFRTRLFLQYITLLFLAGSFIGMCYGAYILRDISDLRHRLDAIRRDLVGVEAVFSSYIDKREELNRYMPFVTFLKGAESAPDAGRFLSLLSGIKTENLRINSISLNITDNVVNGNIRGEINAEGYADTQMYYDRFLESVKGLKGIIIKSHGLELRDKSFHAEIKWNP